jgi:hypothetical protein
MPQSTTKPTYLIVGNSHAAHLYPGLAAVFPGINRQQMSGVGCLPNDDIKTEGQSCAEVRDYLFSKYLPTHHVDAVLLSTLWEDKNVATLGATLDQLAKFPAKVYVIGPIERYDRPLPELLVEDLERGDREAKSFRRHLEPDVFTTESILRDVVHAHPAVRYISIVDLLCPNGECIGYTPDGAPLQSDDSHLTVPGSIFLARKMLQADSFEVDSRVPANR